MASQVPLSFSHAVFVSYVPDIWSPLTLPWNATALVGSVNAPLPKLRLAPSIVPPIGPLLIHALELLIVPVTALPSTVKMTVKLPLSEVSPLA